MEPSDIAEGDAAFVERIPGLSCSTDHMIDVAIRCIFVEPRQGCRLHETLRRHGRSDEETGITRRTGCATGWLQERSLRRTWCSSPCSPKRDRERPSRPRAPHRQRWNGRRQTCRITNSANPFTEALGVYRDGPSDRRFRLRSRIRCWNPAEPARTSWLPSKAREALSGTSVFTGPRIPSSIRRI